MRRGMILGKFLPPHAGHLYLAELGLGIVDELAVVVGSLAREPIPGAVRVGWMRELLPRATVVHLTDENPQTPDEHPRFWPIWEASLRRVLPWKPDVVLASEPYGARLAEMFDAEFVAVDVSRATVPISGTAVRESPMRSWPFLPRCVRPWFVRRVSVFGAESTGKTTLARALAERLSTVAVPEYARGHLELRGGVVTAADMPIIAARQAASEEALARSADRVLITDTDALLTAVWSDALFGEVAPEVATLASAGAYALTLLTDIDVPFEPDPVRYLPDERAAFDAACEAALRAHGRRFIRLSGSPEQRLEAALDAIEPLRHDEEPGDR